MCIDDFFSFLFKMVQSKDFTIDLKMKLISNLLSEDKLIDKLNLKIIKLIDCLLQQDPESTDKILLMEMKLTVLYSLDYPNDFLLKNNIKLYEILSEYLDAVKCDNGFSPNLCQILDGVLLMDGAYSQIINEHLFKFISDDDKIELLVAMSNEQCVKLFDELDNSLVERVGCIKRTRERFAILVQLFIITHPQKALDCYLVYPVKYNYDNLCIDWYWTKSTVYDIYLENNIISEEEAMVLHKVGDIISNGNLCENKPEQLDKLYCEFVHGRTLREVLFPDFIYRISEKHHCN